mmetsp:Transcript_111236/g.319627  ORF Transcript_111236/g.319627 Transcript_111236/m.319627 type:complete len:201 (-) Transcript_111236:86-688(-)
MGDATHAECQNGGPGCEQVHHGPFLAPVGVPPANAQARQNRREAVRRRDPRKGARAPNAPPALEGHPAGEVVDAPMHDLADRQSPLMGAGRGLPHEGGAHRIDLGVGVAVAAVWAPALWRRGWRRLEALALSRSARRMRGGGGARFSPQLGLAAHKAGQHAVQAERTRRPAAERTAVETGRLRRLGCGLERHDSGLPPPG